MILKYKEFLKESEDIEQSIVYLINSGIEDNIKLGFEILKGQKIKQKYFIEKHYGELLRGLDLGFSIKGVMKIFDLKDTFSIYSTKVPENIGILKNIKNLIITGSVISDKLFESICNNLTNLRILSLENCNITKIPSSITNLVNLTTLNLENNSLSVLNTNLFKMEKLQRLYLNHNILKELPEDITKLYNLFDLSISSNYLNKLPKNIGDLQKLKYLDCEQLNLKELPESFYELKNLENLTILKRNNLPKEIIQRIKDSLPKLYIVK